VSKSNQKGLKSNTPTATPFVKWAGGKRKLAPLLIETIPEEFDPLRNRYFEPFIGGGALMFALGDETKDFFIPGRNLFINDVNPELTNAYEVIRDNVNQLIKSLDVLSKRINEKSFYEIRATVPRGKVARAARFIYLNKTCFNGLWRVNSSGDFNVPFGKSKSPSLYNLENLRSCSRRLKGATITNLDFDKAVAKAKKGDLVYLDPPYIPLTSSASFSAYAKEGFSQREHEQLAETIQKLSDKNVYVLLSNSDTPLTRKTFKKVLTLRKVLMARSISSSGSTRKPVYEVLGMNYAHLKGSAMGNLDLISRPN
jgi:DNA adenine methylase